MAHKEGKPTEIRFCTYANATGPKLDVQHSYKIPVSNMSKEDCLKFVSELYKNPHVGTATIYLDNGCHI